LLNRFISLKEKTEGTHHSLIWHDLLYISIEKANRRHPFVSADLFFSTVAESDDSASISKHLFYLQTQRASDVNEVKAMSNTALLSS